MVCRLRRAKADWIGCCHMTVQGTTWLAQRYSLNLNFSFLNWILLLLISSSYSTKYCVCNLASSPSHSSVDEQTRILDAPLISWYVMYQLELSTKWSICLEFIHPHNRVHLNDVKLRRTQTFITYKITL